MGVKLQRTRVEGSLKRVEKGRLTVRNLRMELALYIEFHKQLILLEVVGDPRN